MTMNGIIGIPGHHSVDDIVERLTAMFAAKGLTLFALIDHSGEARKVGMTMPPTKLLVFGNARAGTPLMLGAPSTAIDLPLKILVAEDGDGKVWLSYNDPAYLQVRHGFSTDLVKNIAPVATLAVEAAK